MKLLLRMAELWAQALLGFGNGYPDYVDSLRLRLG
jgi:hypothetical protein